jgi:hypothetical protein
LEVELLEMSGVKLLKVIPRRKGTDISNHDGSVDGHIRIETYEGVGTKIYVDLFDSSIKNATKAHMRSEAFPCTEEGTSKATCLLERYGFAVIIRLE